MITEIKYDPEDWKKEIYIASKTGVNIDESGNETETFAKPVLYRFNVQPITADIKFKAEYKEFGEKAYSMYRATIPISYSDTFKEFDVAYIDDATPEGEISNGYNANYRILTPRKGNAIITLYFERRTGK